MFNFDAAKLGLNFDAAKLGLITRHLYIGSSPFLVS